MKHNFGWPIYDYVDEETRRALQVLMLLSRSARGPRSTRMDATKRQGRIPAIFVADRHNVLGVSSTPIVFSEETGKGCLLSLDVVEIDKFSQANHL